MFLVYSIVISRKNEKGYSRWGGGGEERVRRGRRGGAGEEREECGGKKSVLYTGMRVVRLDW